MYEIYIENLFNKYIIDKNKKGRLDFLLHFFFGIEFAIKVNKHNDKDIRLRIYESHIFELRIKT